jgi:hypothetical protein
MINSKYTNESITFGQALATHHHMEKKLVGDKPRSGSKQGSPAKQVMEDFNRHRVENSPIK